MAAVAKNPKFAKKVGIPQSVGQDFLEADRGKSFRKGGVSNPKQAMMNRPKTNHGMMQMPNYSLARYVGKKEGGSLKGIEMKESKAMMKKEVEFMKKKGAPKSMIKHEMAEAKGMSYGGKVKKMAAGGMTTMKKVADKAVKGHEKRMHKMASGGLSAGHKSADGVATKGKTKARQITMRKGGYC